MTGAGPVKISPHRVNYPRDVGGESDGLWRWALLESTRAEEQSRKGSVTISLLAFALCVFACLEVHTRGHKTGIRSNNAWMWTARAVAW